MKKAVAFLLALALFFGTASLSLASDNLTASKGIRPQLQMTQEQKDKMISLKTEMLELKKQVVAENLKNGTITQEQAKRIEDKINKRLEQLKAGKLERSHHRKHSPKS